MAVEERRSGAVTLVAERVVVVIVGDLGLLGADVVVVGRVVEGMDAAIRGYVWAQERWFQNLGGVEIGKADSQDGIQRLATVGDRRDTWRVGEGAEERGAE